MADDKILSYEDVVLRRSDLDILNGPYFLNDRIIEFYFSYLASNYPSQDILLVPPSISYWITNCPDLNSLQPFVEPLKLPEKKVVIFSVNDNGDVTQAEGGNHWSLLAYERTKNMFVHHDSISGANRWHAKRLYKAVVRFMGNLNGSFVECTSTPQQKNGYDCGLFVTAIAKVICNWYVNDRSEEDEEEEGLWFSALEKQIEESMVSKMRNEILADIKNLIAEK